MAMYVTIGYGDRADDDTTPTEIRMPPMPTMHTQVADVTIRPGSRTNSERVRGAIRPTSPPWSTALSCSFREGADAGDSSGRRRPGAGRRCLWPASGPR